MKRVFAHIGFSFALTLVVLNLFTIKAAFAVLAIAFALFVAFMLVEKTRRAVAVPLVLASCVLACVVFISYYYGSFMPQQRLDGKEIEAVFCITDIEQKTDNGYAYSIRTSFVSEENSPQNIKLSVYSKKQLDAEYYQLVKGKINVSLSAENGYASFGKFADGMFLSGYIYDYEVINEYSSNPYKYILNFKQCIIDVILQKLDGDDAGIVIALVTGNRSYISDELYSMLRICGVMHIMAVSGLHLAVFAGIAYIFLKKLFCPKSLRVVLISLIILLYVAFIGFTPSVVRAGIMMIVFYSSVLVKKKEDSLNSLGLAVFIICLNPYAVTDVGAMLTVSSVLGLITIYPRLLVGISFKAKPAQYCCNTLSAGVAVLITTLPVMYLFFGSVSLIYIFLNLLIIPLVEFVLVSFLPCIIFLFSAVISSVAFAVLDVEADLILLLLKRFAKLSFLIVDLSSEPVGIAIGIVFILMGVTLMLFEKRLKQASVVSGVLLASIIISGMYLNAGFTNIKLIAGESTTALLVYNKNYAFVAGVSDFGQYNEVLQAVEAGRLELLMLVDEDGKYSKKLCEKLKPVNYVAKYGEIDYDSSTVLITDEKFNVDLWQDFNVKYNGEGNNQTLVVTVNDFSLIYTDALTDVSGYDKAAYSAATSGCDYVYSVNNNGYTERRVNDWLR